MAGDHDIAADMCGGWPMSPMLPTRLTSAEKSIMRETVIKPPFLENG
jgi:hypothetical protein